MCVYICFKQALQKTWREHFRALGEKEDVPSDLLNCVELVLNNEDQLREHNRLPGENQVCHWDLLKYY